MRMSRKAWSLGISLFVLSALSSTVWASAGEVVNVNGARYEHNSDGRWYPQIKSEWKSLDGRVHVNWITDYSSAPLMNIKSPNFTESRPNFREQAQVKPGAGQIKPETGNGAAASQSDEVSVRDYGGKRYLTINADCLFDFDKSDLTEKAEKILAKVGPMLQKYSEQPVQIGGHTDSIGDDAYNQELSEKRATTVKNWLVQHGFVVEEHVTTKGYGETCPVARNTYTDGTDYPQGRQKNRRVEICVTTIVAENPQ